MYGIQLRAHAICDTRHSSEPRRQIHKRQSARPTQTPKLTTASRDTKSRDLKRSVQQPVFTAD